MREHTCVACTRPFASRIDFAAGRGPKRCIPCRATYPDAYDGRKQSLYMDEGTRLEMRVIARAHGRSVSWVAREAWRLARDRIRLLSRDRVGG